MSNSQTDETAQQQVAALTAQLADKDAALIEAHGLLDALGIPPAGVCHDKDCRTKLGHRLRALTAQLAEAQESREAYRKMALLREAEATALREALTEALSLAKVATNTWACVARSKRDHDVIGGLHRDIDAMRDKWALGRQPPTGTDVPRCPACGHAPHRPGACLNMASDHDCSCGQPPTGGQTT